MYVEQYVSGSYQTLNSPLCKRHEPNASNSRDVNLHISQREWMFINIYALANISLNYGKM